MATTVDTPIKKTSKAPRKKIATDMQECADTCSRQSCCSSGHKTRGVIIVFLLLVNILTTLYIWHNTNNLEIVRNGGQENYERMMEFMETDDYKEYMTQSANNMIMQLQQANMQQPINMLPQNETGDMSDGTSVMLNEAEENSDIE